MSLLDTFLTERNMPEPEFGAAVGCSQQHVNRLRRGLKPPSLALALRIERFTDGAVPASSWQPPETADTSAMFRAKQGAA